MRLQRACKANSAAGPRGRVGEVLFGWAFVGSKPGITKNMSGMVYDLTNAGSLQVEEPNSTKFTWALNGATNHFGQFTTGVQYLTDYNFAAIGEAADWDKRDRIAQGVNLALNRSLYNVETADVALKASSYEQIVHVGLIGSMLSDAVRPNS